MEPLAASHAGRTLAPIRIVFAELPRMLREILTAALADEPDVELVGHTASLTELKRRVGRGDIDIVILGLTDAEMSAPHYELFDADARVRILALAEQGRTASLYELRPYRTVLGQGSPQELMQTLRVQVRVGASLGGRGR